MHPAYHYTYAILGYLLDCLLFDLIFPPPSDAPTHARSLASWPHPQPHLNNQPPHLCQLHLNHTHPLTSVSCSCSELINLLATPQPHPPTHLCQLLMQRGHLILLVGQHAFNIRHFQLQFLHLFLRLLCTLSCFANLALQVTSLIP